MPLDNKVRSRFVGDNKPGETKRLRNSKLLHHGELIKTPYYGCDTILTAFENTCNRIPNNKFLGTRAVGADGKLGEYKWKTWREARELGQNASRGLIKLNLCPKTSGEGKEYRFLGIYSRNREEWVVTDIACLYNDISSVGFFDTSTPDNIQFIINQTEMTTIMGSEPNIKKLLEIKKSEPKSINTLVNLVSYDPISITVETEAKALGFKTYTFNEVIEAGKHATDIPFSKPKPDSVYTFCYTSGSTGVPKGAMGTHSNFLTSIASIEAHEFNFTQNDVHMSYLPLPHSMEHTLMTIFYTYGVQVGFFGGDVNKLMEDLAVLKPTFLATVPRILNKIYAGIQNKINEMPFPKKQIARYAIFSKLQGLKENCEYTSSWDSMIFDKMKQLVGGRVRVMITGASPISAEVLDFLKICFCCPIREGYGMTENTSCCTITMADDPTAGHVGDVLAGTDIKLQDVPEMSYTSKDIVDGVPTPRGEICCKGPAVFPGYYKAPDKNLEMFDEEGWLHTGDIGAIQPNGTLKIIDRKKHLFKLAQGEYLAPEKIENILLTNPIITQVFVHGDSLEQYPVAIIVPDEVLVKKWAESHGIKGDFRDLVQKKELKEYILGLINAACKQAKLNGFEIPKNIHLTVEPFTIEAQLLTPTMKLKRHHAKIVFAKELRDLYAAAKAGKL